MSLLRSRNRHRETVELNITAFMNLMVILVPFLLITAVFSQVSILELNLPADGTDAAEPAEPELQLEITIRGTSIERVRRISGPPHRRVPRVISGTQVTLLRSLAAHRPTTAVRHRRRSRRAPRDRALPRG